jgi:hypothetical protein
VAITRTVLGDMPLARPMEKEAYGEAAEVGRVGRVTAWSGNRWCGVAVWEKIPRRTSRHGDFGQMGMGGGRRDQWGQAGSAHKNLRRPEPRAGGARQSK